MESKSMNESLLHKVLAYIELPKLLFIEKILLSITFFTKIGFIRPVDAQVKFNLFLVFVV
jgi:hypothetical protein